MKRVVVIAEIGCNHNGSVLLAKKMIKQAKECGVDAVKFQTFHSEALISRYAPKADYQKVTTGTADSQLEMTKRLELSHEDFQLLSDYAEQLNLFHFSTPFDLDSIGFLESVGQSIWKIPSGEITNLPYLQKIGSLLCKEKKILLSTGMSTINEIESCIRILENAGTKRKQITLLHCNTEYPTPDEDVNLSAILDLRKHFPDMLIGFSDHSVGATAAIGAVALGAVIIEKHFTLDKNLPGPDHKASATPDELSAICEGVHRMECMIGCGEKIVTKSEQKNIAIARKSIVAACRIRKGEVFTEKNITCKRPGNGISPINWYKILGQKAEWDFDEDQLISAKGFDWVGQ